jgi:hypothetical protein
MNQWPALETSKDSGPDTLATLLGQETLGDRLPATLDRALGTDLTIFGTAIVADTATSAATSNSPPGGFTTLYLVPLGQSQGGGV